MKAQRFVLSREPDLLCDIQCGLFEKNCISRPLLGKEGEISGDYIGYSRIAAGGLAVGHQDDGLTVTGDLNGAQGDACRDDVGHPFLMPDGLS